MSRELNLPPWWPSAGITAKAEWLVNSHHAKNLPAAYSLLSKLRRPRPVKQPPVVARLPYSD